MFLRYLTSVTVELPFFGPSPVIDDQKKEKKSDVIFCILLRHFCDQQCHQWT